MGQIKSWRWVETYSSIYFLQLIFWAWAEFEEANQFLLLSYAKNKSTFVLFGVLIVEEVRFLIKSLALGSNWLELRG
jgi:hypothetical protein